MSVTVSVTTKKYGVLSKNPMGRGNCKQTSSSPFSFFLGRRKATEGCHTPIPMFACMHWIVTRF